MLESIIDSVKGQLVANLTEKTGLGAQQAEASVPLAKESITEGITSALSGGNFSNILNMVERASGQGSTGGNLTNNAVYQTIAGNFVGKLTSRLGIPDNVAQKVSSVALPFIMSHLASKTRQAGDTDEVDQGSLMSVLGLDSGGLLGKVGGMFGKKDDDGDDGNDGGGLGGALGGFLK
ncbi:hypothetical protein GGR28_001948 [Lewinella aquimaris]|uniref:DUF937 domain-containing protein n=1 Tax=Neolewinella aquimaris TaxID=1835722 RepID=A0A840EBE2_9BACT|nr:DUF937 domain-containing protein [Neolewinella aquimaris]MBB4079328.1 hypothetical protein [Neolewinella aquimaris]